MLHKHLVIALAAPLVLAAGLSAGATLPGCTPAQRATAGTVINDVGSAAPLVCQIPGTGGATVCGQDAGIVSDVAKLVASILAAIPAKKAEGLPVGPQVPTAIAYRGCVITLPAGIDAAAFRKALP